MTSKELAELIGISQSTVSMVLNNKPGVSKETREMVLSAAQNFGLSAKAQTADTGKEVFALFRKTRGVASNNSYFEQLLEGVNLACRDYGCVLQFFSAGVDEERHRHIETIQSIKADGLILVGSHIDHNDIQAARKLNVPFVLLGSEVEDERIGSISMDNRQGAALAVNHMIEKGHRRLGYLKCSERIFNFREREKGMLEAVERNGLSAEEIIVHELPFGAEQTYEKMKELLNKPCEPDQLATAYFADDDDIAIGAMKAFIEAGYKVPEDVSFVGFDNMPLCTVTNPALTSVWIDKYQMGYVAIDYLRNQKIHKNWTPMKIRIFNTLIERDSVSQR